MFLEHLHVKKEQNAVAEKESARHLASTQTEAYMGLTQAASLSSRCLHDLLYLPVDACRCYCIVQYSCGPGRAAGVFVKLQLLEKLAAARGLLQAVPGCRASASFTEGNSSKAPHAEVRQIHI